MGINLFFKKYLSPLHSLTQKLLMAVLFFPFVTGLLNCSLLQVEILVLQTLLPIILMILHITNSEIEMSCESLYA